MRWKHMRALRLAFNCPRWMLCEETSFPSPIYSTQQRVTESLKFMQKHKKKTRLNGGRHESSTMGKHLSAAWFWATNISDQKSGSPIEDRPLMQKAASSPFLYINRNSLYHLLTLSIIICKYHRLNLINTNLLSKRDEVDKWRSDLLAQHSQTISGFCN